MTDPPVAAVYRPVRRVGGRAVRGDDEDAFTLAAAVLERIAFDRTTPDVWELATEGAASEIPDDALARLLGTAVRRRPPSEGGSGRSAPSTIHLAVDLAEGEGDDCAVAVRGDAIAAAASTHPGRRSTERLLAATSSLSRGEVAEIGGAPGAPGVEPRTPASGASGAAVLARVSEGALLPRARYLEGIPSHWRLEGERCGACGRIGFPARGRCRECGASDRLTPHRFPLDGHPVIAATRIESGAQPTEFDPQVERSGPYQVVLIELGPTARATLQATDPERGPLAIGDRAATVLRRSYALEGEWRYARKAVRDRPTGSRGSGSGEPAQ